MSDIRKRLLKVLVRYLFIFSIIVLNVLSIMSYASEYISNRLGNEEFSKLAVLTLELADETQAKNASEEDPTEQPLNELSNDETEFSYTLI